MATVALWGAWISLIAGALLIALGVMGWIHGRRAASEVASTTTPAKVPLAV